MGIFDAIGIDLGILVVMLMVLVLVLIVLVLNVSLGLHRQKRRWHRPARCRAPSTHPERRR